MTKTPRDDLQSRDLDIIERDRVVPELLISFVPLTGNQHNVARSRERNSTIDCLGAIDDFFIPIRTQSLFDLANDGVWIFLAGIIRGDDGVVSKAICHLGHERALLPVAIAAAAENRNQTLRGEFAKSFQNVAERVGRMRVIDEYLELSLCRNQFQTPGHLRRLGKAKHRISQIDSESVGRSQSSERICHIKPTD